MAKDAATVIGARLICSVALRYRRQFLLSTIAHHLGVILKVGFADLSNIGAGH